MSLFFFFFSSRRRHTRLTCDWSSDVCSSDLEAALRRLETLLALVEGWVDAVVAAAAGDRMPGADALREASRRRQIGRASCRERVEISGGAVSLKKKEEGRWGRGVG